MKDFMPGEKVVIQKSGSPENGITGTLKTYDPESGFYFVEFKDGPPWRGFYEGSEMFNAEASGPDDKDSFGAPDGCNLTPKKGE